MKRCGFHIAASGSCRHPEFMTMKSGGFCSRDFPSIVGFIEHPDEGVILFDTGYDPAFFAATNMFPEKLYRWTTPVTLREEHTALHHLQKLGYKSEDVKRIVISHFHGDHVAGLHNFPHAKISCSRAGFAGLSGGGRLARVRRGILSSLVPEGTSERTEFFEDAARVALPSVFYPFTDAVDVLNDGSLLVVELPGHCAGHWGLILKTEKDRLVFLIADAAWSMRAVAENLPPPMLTTLLLGCTDAYSKTLAGLHRLQRRNTGVVILPSHCRTALAQFERGAG